MIFIALIEMTQTSLPKRRRWSVQPWKSARARRWPLAAKE